MDLIGSRLGSWTIIERLGKGGQGSVWLGEKRQIDGSKIKAAIKTPDLDKLPVNALNQMLAHEYEMIRTLDNPYLAKYLDSGIERFGKQGEFAVQWLALEFVAGQSLQDEISREGILDEPRWLELAHDTLSALASLHEKGIIHSDIKPGNIMRSSRRSVLVDLGGASLVGIRDAGDMGGGVATAAFAAPEQLDMRVDAKDYGYEIDIFSLGMTLVVAATGSAPWDEVVNGPTKQFKASAQQHYLAIRDTPPRLAGLSPKQKELVLQMLSFDPQRRTPAATLLKQVRELLPQGAARKDEASPSAPVRWVPQNSTNSGRQISYGSSNDESAPKWTASVLIALFGYGIGAILRLIHFNSNEIWRYKRRRAEYIFIGIVAFLFSLGIAGIYQSRVWTRLGASKLYSTLSISGPVLGLVYFGSFITMGVLANTEDLLAFIFLGLGTIAGIGFIGLGAYLSIPPKQAISN